MEFRALGYCRLTRGEFYGMTPREFNMRVQAEIERENRAFERTAQLACWVLNPWLKKADRISVRMLLGRKRRVKPDEGDD